MPPSSAAPAPSHAAHCMAATLFAAHAASHLWFSALTAIHSHPLYSAISLGSPSPSTSPSLLYRESRELKSPSAIAALGHQVVLVVTAAPTESGHSHLRHTVSLNPLSNSPHSILHSIAGNPAAPSSSSVPAEDRHHRSRTLLSEPCCNSSRWEYLLDSPKLFPHPPELPPHRSAAPTTNRPRRRRLSATTRSGPPQSPPAAQVRPPRTVASPYHRHLGRATATPRAASLASFHVPLQWPPLKPLSPAMGAAPIRPSLLFCPLALCAPSLNKYLTVEPT